MYEELDAKVLDQTAQRLFTESVASFRNSHKLGMHSFKIASRRQQIEQFSLAINGEMQAFEKQREAIEILKKAWSIRAKRLEDREWAKDQE